MRVAVILPARNEASALRQVLSEIPRTCVHEIIVADNGSSDGTADVARAAGARVVTEPRPGYGRACLRALAALDPEIDTVVFLDADHSDYPEELPRLLAPIASGVADLVIGSRVRQAEPGSLTLPQRLGNRLACALLRWWFGVQYTDLGPFRAIRRTALESLNMRDETFGWTVEMQAKAARHGLRGVEVPVRYRRRIGRSKISGTMRGILSAGTIILWTIGTVALERPAAGSTSRMRTRRLAIFLKYPTPGRVKTRLAATVGLQAACALYRVCIELTLERLAAFRRDIMLWVDPPEALQAARTWLGTGWSYRVQMGTTLGERLSAAARVAFAEGARRVVLIGTDAPWVRGHDIDAAYSALERADLVLGPTDDGGYYLIGLSRWVPEVFERIAWSTPAVYAQTRQRAASLGLRVVTLPPGYDLDDIDDVRRFVGEEERHQDRPQAVAAIRALSQRRVP